MLYLVNTRSDSTILPNIPFRLDFILIQKVEDPRAPLTYIHLDIHHAQTLLRRNFHLKPWYVV